ncbi:MAG TPA: DUF3460 family protein, partial [Gallionella sp.]|nr:DUF3460 family protein [Gallionella sp.]
AAMLHWGLTECHEAQTGLPGKAFFTLLRKGGTEMSKGYVSEFSVFMDRYLHEHPEAAKEQCRDWDEDWHPRNDLEALDREQEDIAPDDGYGFAWTAWRLKPSSTKGSGTTGNR